MRTHGLDSAEIAALATGPVSTELVLRLRSAELSKHLVLLEAVRRGVARQQIHIESTDTEIDNFERILSALARLQEHLAQSILCLPQIGAWAGRSLSALSSGGHVDLKYLTDLIDRTRQTDDDPRLVGGTRLQISHFGVTLDVTLAHADPYLDLYGPRADTPSSEEVEAWRHRLTRAWQLIVQYDQTLAAAISAGLSTIVPLREGPDKQPLSATSGWAFGAIALSLPRDDLWCADSLVHEFRHLLLGAVADHFPLVQSTTDRPAYAPWREDPRPSSGLLYGCHAYLGLLEFWGRQGESGALMKFARWLEPTADVIERLLASEVLTHEGTLLAGSMQKRLEEWRSERRPSAADRLAVDAAADHRLRWRLRFLRPENDALDALVDAWSTGAAPIMTPRMIAKSPAPGLEPGTRTRLLEMACGGYEKYYCPPDTAAQSVLDGYYDAAAAEYKMRIATKNDPDAWAGLSLCRLRSSPRSAIVRRPEEVASLYARLQRRHRGSVDPDRLSAWLTGNQVIIGSMSSGALPR